MEIQLTNSLLQKQTYYVYMVRIDADHKEQDTIISYIRKEILSYEITVKSPDGSYPDHQETEYHQYITSNENKKNGIPHQQMALLFKDAKHFTDNKIRQLRNYMNTQTYVYKHKNAVAIKKARNAKSLLKYVNDKEQKGMKTDLDEVQLKQIGKWKDKELDKKQLKDKIIEQYVKEKKTLHRNLFKIELIQIAVKVAIEEERKPPPIKSLYYYAQLANVLSKLQVAEYSYGYEYQSALQEYEMFSKKYPSQYAPCPEAENYQVETDDEA